jgi:hypothetical protein
MPTRFRKGEQLPLTESARASSKIQGRHVEQYCEEAIVAVLIMDETDRNADEDEIH